MLLHINNLKQDLFIKLKFYYVGRYLIHNAEDITVLPY